MNNQRPRILGLQPNTGIDWKGWVALAVLALLTVAIYAPGLRGSFVYDDSTFLLENSRVQVRSLRLAEWVDAALSFPSGIHVGRWLGMLSFAANHYFTGLDPFWLKLTNLGIHLINGLLVFLMLRSLFALRKECGGNNKSVSFDPGLASAAIAGLWLVLPINLTAVLYVSQRLESLSNTFVFLGLWLYLRARLTHWRGVSGAFGLWSSLLICTGLGVLVKESAAMLPLYAACIELSLTGGRSHDGRVSRSVLGLYGLLIGVPLVAGSIWLLSWVGGASSYARPFDTVERLLTETRVVIDYIQWTLVPLPESLTLYHDDVSISHGLLDPPSTLAAVAGLFSLLALALWQRSRRPLFSLGVLWFFCGHLLTGTVIPLMLVMEHRNYFPSVGLLLAGASLVTLEGGLTRAPVRITLAGCALVFFAFTTWMRAEEWSDPLRLALSEANKRPNSSAAQYELGRTLMYSRRKGENKPMTEEGFEVLERASHIPGSDILHEQLLIVGHAQLGRPIEQRWWDSLIAKLNARPPTTADIAALIQLLHCYEQSVCGDEVGKLKLAFDAAMSHPSTNTVLLLAHGEFADRLLHDSELAEKEFRAAITKDPNDANARANLVAFLTRTGETEQARAELAALQQLNHFGSLDLRIAELEKGL